MEGVESSFPYPSNLVLDYLEKILKLIFYTMQDGNEKPFLKRVRSVLIPFTEIRGLSDFQGPVSECAFYRFERTVGKWEALESATYAAKDFSPCSSILFIGGKQSPGGCRKGASG
jgi:hypothetical protein